MSVPAFFHFLLFGSAALALAYSPEVCQKPGTCVGSPVKEVQGYVNQCLDVYYGDSSFKYFTYDYNKKKCQIFLSCQEVDPTCTSCFSFSLIKYGSCHVGKTYALPATCQHGGTEIGKLRAPSSSDCKDQCSQANGCHWFTFSYTGGHCTMYSDCVVTHRQAGDDTMLYALNIGSA